jgi:hypothetical protein
MKRVIFASILVVAACNPNVGRNAPGAQRTRVSTRDEDQDPCQVTKAPVASVRAAIPNLKCLTCGPPPAPPPPAPKAPAGSIPVPASDTFIRGLGGVAYLVVPSTETPGGKTVELLNHNYVAIAHVSLGGNGFWGTFHVFPPGGIGDLYMRIGNLGLKAGGNVPWFAFKYGGAWSAPMINGTALQKYLAAMPAAQVSAFNIFNHVGQDLGTAKSLSEAVRSSSFSMGQRSSATDENVPASGVCSPEFVLNTFEVSMGLCLGALAAPPVVFACAFGIGSILACSVAVVDSTPDSDGTLPYDEVVELETVVEDSTECTEQCDWNDDDSGDEDPSSPDGDGSGCCGECG